MKYVKWLTRLPFLVLETLFIPFSLAVVSAINIWAWANNHYFYARWSEVLVFCFEPLKRWKP